MGCLGNRQRVRCKQYLFTKLNKSQAQCPTVIATAYTNHSREQRTSALHAQNNMFEELHLIRLIRFRLLPRAASGCGEACARLAWLYFEGAGLDKDFEKSFEWCSRAAEIGSPAGQFSFGCVVAAVDGELMLHAAWLYVYLTHCGVPVACTMRG